MKAVPCAMTEAEHFVTLCDAMRFELDPWDPEKDFNTAVSNVLGSTGISIESLSAEEKKALFRIYDRAHWCAGYDLEE